MLRPAGTRKLGLEGRQHLPDESQYPPPFEEPFRRQRVRRLDRLVARFTCLEIERQVGLAAAAFFCPRALALVRQEVLQRRQQKRAEAPPIAIGGGDRVLLEQLREEGLRQVLRV